MTKVILLRVRTPTAPWRRCTRARGASPPGSPRTHWPSGGRHATSRTNAAPTAARESGRSRPTAADAAGAGTARHEAAALRGRRWPSGSAPAAAHAALSSQAPRRGSRTRSCARRAGRPPGPSFGRRSPSGTWRPSRARSQGRAPAPRPARGAPHQSVCARGQGRKPTSSILMKFLISYL